MRSQPKQHDEAASGGWATVPNLLSAARILATPVFAWLILTQHRVAATILLAVMGFTDFLDGRIARASGRISKLGVVLDPASDRLVVVVCLIALVANRSLPLWLGAAVLAREVLLLAAYAVVASSGFGRPKVSRLGKMATALLFVALPLLVLGSVARPAGLSLFAVGAALYYAAGLGYARDVLRWARTRKTPARGAS